MRVLVVGAGAVGQVFARHLKLGGADVSFFVKQKYAQECRQGFTLYPLNEVRPSPFQEPIHFEALPVLTSPEELSRQQWDYIFLCIPSTGLRGDWLKGFAEAAGKAYFVSFQPSPGDFEFLSEYVPPTRIISGLIAFLSYFAPLPEEKLPTPGLAYWFPPLSPTLLSGPSMATDQILTVLLDGGLPAKKHPNVQSANALPNAILMTLVTALEKHAWSFEALCQTENLKPALRAAHEAVRINCAHQPKSLMVARAILQPFVFRTLLRTARAVMPLNLEAFLKAHFTKVRPQTQLAMNLFIQNGERLGLNVSELRTITNGHGPC